MKLRVTGLESHTEGSTSRDPSIAEIDIHVEHWSQAGWELVAVTTLARPDVTGGRVSHKFFWRRSSSSTTA